MPLSTVRRCSPGSGSASCSRLEPPEPPNRYERTPAGRAASTSTSRSSAASAAAPATASPATARAKAAPTDVRRGTTGWEFVHVCVDDATTARLRRGARRRESDRPPIAFLRRAVAHFAAHGIQVERVMTDNGSAYVSTTCTRSPASELGIKHLRTRPYRPRTNGKAERFIRTLLGGWAYGAHLQQLRRTLPSPRRLARLLQSPTTTPALPQPPTATTAAEALRRNNLAESYNQPAPSEPAPPPAATSGLTTPIGAPAANAFTWANASPK